MQRTKEERMAFTERYVNRQESLYKLYNQHVWSSGYTIEDYRRGQWRSHSWCETGGCDCCKNPRRAKWNSLDEQHTMQERKQNGILKAQLDEYYTDS